MQQPVAQFTVGQLVIHRADVIAAQSYIMHACVLALVCSSWTLSNYIDGNVTMRAYAWIGTVASGLLLAGIITEVLFYRRPKKSTWAYTYAEAARQKGLGVALVHVATATIGIFSVCVAAVNVYGNASSGLYAMSCIVIAYNWIYYVFFTPNTVMHLAVNRYLSDAELHVIAVQQKAMQLVWRKSAVTPSADLAQ